MKKSSKARYIILGMLIMAIISSTAIPAFASTTLKQLNAYFRGIKIVVDGELMNPIDANGKAIEPFIVDGTIYMPLKTIGEAFNKPLEWDGDTNTVYIGGRVNKPALALPMYSRPYTECNKSGDFRAYTDKGIDYVGFNFQYWNFQQRADKSGYDNNAYVIYPLNGVATKLTGTILSPTGNGFGNVLGLCITYTFRDESGRLLYQSPIIIESTAPVSFEIDVSKCLSIKIELSMELTDRKYSNEFAGLIENLALTTTDYQ